MKFQYLLISVDELWLKGKNRGMYVRTLHNHIVNVLKHSYSSDFRIKNHQQRFIVSTTGSFDEITIKRISNIPGIFTISPALKYLQKDIDFVGGEICTLLESHWSKEESLTFKVSTQRVDKLFQKTSVETSRDVGAIILKHFDKVKQLKVKLVKPEYDISLRILPDAIYVSFEKIMAVGGFPVGTNGHLVSLLSGGFDSPVASYLMAQRGCQNTYAFFYSYPFVGEEVKEKIIKITKELSKFQKTSILYVIPFGDIQKKISKNCKESYRTIFFRKFMFETAAKLCQKINADALVTGDSLGQVSSQTISNLSMMDQFIDKTIFRPLVGMGKKHIISISREIELHDISVIPHDDACSLFSPKHPVITSNKKYWDEFMSSNDLSEDISIALENSEIFKFNCIGELE